MMPRLRSAEVEVGSESPSGFLPFLLNSLRRVVLRAFDPLRKCGRIHKGVWIAGFAGFQRQAAFEHATARIPVFLGPAVNLQVHLYALNPGDLVRALDRLFRFGEPTS
jgi:hypothetical protein